MICKHCGTSVKDGAKFCPVCGAAAEQPQQAAFTSASSLPQEPATPAAAPAPESTYTAPPAASPAAPVYAAPAANPAYEPPRSKPVTEDALPEQYRPLSPWAYFGLQILFSIPIVGFVFLIVFSCSKSNINRRNFARSYWCALLIVGVLLVIVAVIAILAGVSLSALESGSFSY